MMEIEMYFRDSDGMRSGASRGHDPHWSPRVPATTTVFNISSADCSAEQKVTILVALYERATTKDFDMRCRMSKSVLDAIENYIIARECGDELGPYVALLIEIWENGAALYEWLHRRCKTAI